MPDQDAVIAITCETPDMQGELNLVWKYLLPAIKNDKLPENPAHATTLKTRLSSLALPVPENGAGTSIVEKIQGKTYVLDKNGRHLENINFQFSEKICKVTLVIDSREYDFTLGSEEWIKGKTTLLGPNLLYYAKAHFVGLPPSEVAGSYGWMDDNTLELVLRYIESPHSETIICSFDGKYVTVSFRYSNVPDPDPAEIKGIVKD